MIFQYTMDAVLARRKTQTRREIYPGDRLEDYRGALAVVKINGMPRWIVGKSYSIHRRRGLKAEPKVRVVVKRLWKDNHPLQLSKADARAEGFASQREFAEAWHQLHKKDAAHPCWAIEFQLLEGEANADTTYGQNRQDH